MKFSKILLLTCAWLFTLTAAHSQSCNLRDNGDGTVSTPYYAGMKIQKCSVGQKWSGSACTGSVALLKWQDAVTRYGEGTWRLMTIAEGDKLRLAVGSQCDEFKEVQSTLTSSADVASSGTRYARTVDLYFNTTDGAGLGDLRPVRLVSTSK